MSRDAFSHDPQDTLDLRQTGARPSAREHGTSLSHTRGDRNSAPNTSAHRDRTESREQHPARDEHRDSRRAYYVRDRAYLLRDSEMHSLKDVGKFRVIPTTDLAKYAYGGDRNRMEKDVRRLAGLGLLTDKTIELSHKKTLRIVTLTKAGHRLLKKTNQVRDDQAIYHGFLKPRELKHDADLYRVYHKESARIEYAGGRPLRVILDYELKKNLNRDLALLGQKKDDPERKAEVAGRHGLQVVNGKIPIPDLRLEYETAELEHRHVDLELATRDYRPRAVAEKVSAGFSLYGRPEDASRLRRVLDEQEITARILSL